MSDALSLTNVSDMDGSSHITPVSYKYRRDAIFFLYRKQEGTRPNVNVFIQSVKETAPTSAQQAHPASYTVHNPSSGNFVEWGNMCL